MVLGFQKQEIKSVMTQLLQARAEGEAAQARSARKLSRLESDKKYLEDNLKQMELNHAELKLAYDHDNQMLSRRETELASARLHVGPNAQKVGLCEELKQLCVGLVLLVILYFHALMFLIW